VSSPPGLKGEDGSNLFDEGDEDFNVKKHYIYTYLKNNYAMNTLFARTKRTVAREGGSSSVWALDGTTPRQTPPHSHGLSDLRRTTIIESPNAAAERGFWF